MKRDLDLTELARSILMAPYAKPKPEVCRCDRLAFPHRSNQACHEAEWDRELEREAGDDMDAIKSADDAARARDMNKAAR